MSITSSPTFAVTPAKLSNDSLVNLIQQCVSLLRNRGAKALAAETLSSELEDLHLEDVSNDALEQRAGAMALETGPLA